MESDKAAANKKKMKRIQELIINVMILAVGNCGGPLRFDFVHGCKRIRLYFPHFIPLLVTLVTYFKRGHKASADPASSTDHAILMDRRIFLVAAAIGVLIGVDYQYAYGVSTSALMIIASQLAFIALFAFLLVKQKFMAFSIKNVMLLLTVGVGVLALHTSSDRSHGEMEKVYYLGFVMTIAAPVLYGFVLPLVKFAYKKAREVIPYKLVLEIQLVMCFFATLVCTIGMIINKDTTRDVFLRNSCLYSTIEMIINNDFQVSIHFKIMY